MLNKHDWLFGLFVAPELSLWIHNLHKVTDFKVQGRKSKIFLHIAEINQIKNVPW